MTLQIFRETEIPSSKWMWDGSTANTQINASTEKVAGIFFVPVSGTVDKVAIRLGTVTVSDTLKVSLQTVDDTTGYPTGTYYYTNAYGTVSGLSSNTTVTVDITSGSVTKGDIIAIVVEFNSYVSGDLQIKHCTKNSSNFPYVSTYLSSVWAKVSYVLITALIYDVGGTDTYYPMNEAILYNGNGWRTFNSGSTNNEYSLRFKITYPVRVTGFWIGSYAENTSANFDIILYSGTTPLSTKSIDGNRFYNDANSRYFLGYFPETIELTKDTEYRIAIKPTTTNNIGLSYATFSSTNQMGAWPGGSEFYGSYRNAGAWTNETTTRYSIGLIVDECDDGTGGGASGGGLPIMAGSIVR